MILNTKTGILLSGTIGKAPELRYVGQNERAVLKFSIRYGSEQDDTGKWRGKYIDVDVWNNAEELDGMLAEDDAVIVTAREIKSREYNGKTYYSVSADGIFPGAGVVFRWMQQIADMIPAAAGPAGFVPVNAPVPEQFAQAGPADITGHELYPGEQLSAYSLKARAGARAAECDLIADDEDLPF